MRAWRLGHCHAPADPAGEDSRQPGEVVHHRPLSGRRGITDTLRGPLRRRAVLWRHGGAPSHWGPAAGPGWECRLGPASAPWVAPPQKAQTGPKDCLPQCRNKCLCRLGVIPSSSIPGAHMLEAPFCLYAAWLLIERRHAGSSRLFPHWCKGGFGHVWEAWPPVAPFSTQRLLPSEARSHLRHPCTSRTLIAAAPMLRGLRRGRHSIRPRSWCRPPRAASGPRHSPAAPQARSLQGCHREAEGPHVAATRSATPALAPRLSPDEG